MVAFRGALVAVLGAAPEMMLEVAELLSESESESESGKYILSPELELVTRASVGEWGLSRTKVYSGAVGVLRVAMSGSRQGIGRGRDLR